MDEKKKDYILKELRRKTTEVTTEEDTTDIITRNSFGYANDRLMIMSGGFRNVFRLKKNINMDYLMKNIINELNRYRGLGMLDNSKKPHIIYKPKIYKGNPRINDICFFYDHEYYYLRRECNSKIYTQYLLYKRNYCGCDKFSRIIRSIYYYDYFYNCNAPDSFVSPTYLNL
jgi:hypothetical protein